MRERERYPIREMMSDAGIRNINRVRDTLLMREQNRREKIQAVHNARDFGYHSWSPEERAEYDAMYDR